MKPSLSAVFSLLVAALLSLGASCGGAGQKTPSTTGGGPSKASGPRIESLKQVETGDLTDAERELWVDLINDQLSPCGEPISVAKCVSEQGKCGACVTAARYLVRLVMEGYDRETIAAHYSGRFTKPAQTIATDGAPSRGAPMAKVTIVEFSDFECPHCGMAHPEVQRVLREFDGRVRLVYKHFPLSGHMHALPAARAAEAARLQGKFWEMHDTLFEHQRDLSDEQIKKFAADLGLDMPRFEADMASEATQKAIEAAKAEGVKLGVASTPSFFIGGRQMQESPRSLAAYVREELEL